MLIQVYLPENNNNNQKTMKIQIVNRITITTLAIAGILMLVLIGKSTGENCKRPRAFQTCDVAQEPDCQMISSPVCDDNFNTEDCAKTDTVGITVQNDYECIDDPKGNTCETYFTLDCRVTTQYVCEDDRPEGVCYKDEHGEWQFAPQGIGIGGGQSSGLSTTIYKCRMKQTGTPTEEGARINWKN